jgi:hypothetical protein
MKQKNKALSSQKSSGQKKGQTNRMRHRIGRKMRWEQLELPFMETVHFKKILANRMPNTGFFKVSGGSRLINEVLGVDRGSDCEYVRIKYRRAGTEGPEYILNRFIYSWIWIAPSIGLVEGATFQGKL